MICTLCGVHIVPGSFCIPNGYHNFGVDLRKEKKDDLFLREEAPLPDPMKPKCFAVSVDCEFGSTESELALERMDDIKQMARTR